MSVLMSVDGTEPLSRWIPLEAGPFVMHRQLLTVMPAHFIYSVVLYVGLARGGLSPTTVYEWPVRRAAF